MNRYPLWKYILIGLAIAVGFLYTMPNFCGESPAVQVSPVRSTMKPDSTMQARVEDILTKAGVKPDRVLVDETGVKARFEDPETQIRARDTLQKALGEDFVVALNLLSNNPNW